MVVGAVGVYTEEKWMPKPKDLTYLEHSRAEERVQRLLKEDMSAEILENQTLAEEKAKIVPKSSLLLNQPRSASEKKTE